MRTIFNVGSVHLIFTRCSLAMHCILSDSSSLAGGGEYFAFGPYPFSLSINSISSRTTAVLREEEPEGRNLRGVVIKKKKKRKGKVSAGGHATAKHSVKYLIILQIKRYNRAFPFRKPTDLLACKGKKSTRICAYIHTIAVWIELLGRWVGGYGEEGMGFVLVLSQFINRSRLFLPVSPSDPEEVC